MRQPDLVYDFERRQKNRNDLWHEIAITPDENKIHLAISSAKGFLEYRIWKNSIHMRKRVNKLLRSYGFRWEGNIRWGKLERKQKIEWNQKLVAVQDT